MEPYIQLREKSVSRTTVGHLGDKDLMSIRLIVPDQKMSEKLNGIMDNTLDKIITNQNQNQERSGLRDWLLPMLMNGQVSVGKGSVCEMVEEVLSMAAEGEAGYGGARE